MRIAAIAFTQRGLETARRALPGVEIAQGFGADKPALEEWTRENFAGADALVFVGAVGIAVRAVAPHLRGKALDPAVVAVDEGGRFVIPLVGGHIGGANALALTLAQRLDAQPVLTTATDDRGLWAADSWAVRRGLAVWNPQAVKMVSARLLAGEPVGVWTEVPVEGRMPAGLVSAPAETADVWITERVPQKPGRALVLRVRPLVLGAGCRRGVSEAALEEAVSALPVDVQAIGMLASIDRKRDEPALTGFARRRKIPFAIYTAEQLRGAKGEFSGSAFVERTVGVDNVCERAAVLAAGGPLAVKKQAGCGITLAVARRKIRLHWEEDSL